MLTTLILALAAVPSAAMIDPCQSLQTQEEQIRSNNPVSVPRLVTAWELATITDIGRGEPYAIGPLIGVSPDGKSIAVILRRADPATNRFCQRLVTLPVTGAAIPKELERGGDLNRDTYALRGLAAMPTGYEKAIAPKWSPDGKLIAFLRKDGGPTQIWVVGSQGGDPHPVTRSLDAIEDFTWTPDGSGFIAKSRPGLRLAEKAFAAEALKGYEYDVRFDPLISNEPNVPEPVATVFSRIDLGTGVARVASTSETAWLEPTRDSAWQKGWRHVSTSSSGNRALVVASNTEEIIAPSRLIMDWTNGRHTMCEEDACTKASQLWWSPDGKTLTFATRVGWKSSQTAFYRWTFGADKPEPLFTTQDVVTGCAQSANTLICVRDGAAAPRRIVAIDLANGHARVVYNPNERFDRLKLGSVQRLTFVNSLDVKCYADLVLPPDHKPGQKHPMVLVQYSSDGFLRGSTGDEEPIQVLASRGFAVLSIQHPGMVPGSEKARSERELREMDTANFANRRSVQSAIETAIGLAVATGTVDETRMGISGMSEGASATQWALIHSSLFKVASLGVCCEEQIAQPLAGGPGYAQYLREMGYPAFDTVEDKFWPEMSLARNIDRIKEPILIQTGGNEYQTALYDAQAFRDRGKPLDFYIFPNETHVKWEPAHRLAMYERNVDWFSFWLLHQRDCVVEKAPQYARWLAMRGAPREAELTCWKATSPDP